MTQATFREGQLVRLRLDQHTGLPDLYQIVSILPVASNGDLQYRLRGIYEAHERMAAEHQISALTNAPQRGAGSNGDLCPPLPRKSVRSSRRLGSNDAQSRGSDERDASSAHDPL